MLDLALEEKLDELDPLRHFREDTSDIDGGTDTLVPVQPPSVRNQTIQLAFPASPDNHDTPQPQPPLTITLAVDASPGCGGIAWPAGEVLASYIARRGSLQGKNVLELGSGTGLVGLVAAKLGARVCITDQAPLLGIMKQNVSLNGLESRVSVMELNWGEPIPPDLSKPDLVLAADCVYFEPAFPLLVKTLADLVPDRSTEVLFCYKKRRKVSGCRPCLLLFRRAHILQGGQAVLHAAEEGVCVGGGGGRPSARGVLAGRHLPPSSTPKMSPPKLVYA
ncbi:putative methyltransferase-domain-containing protein [Trametes punicea]|nr:putative methyltransferase-domain-containing protein [Trametes punicea]